MALRSLIPVVLLVLASAGCMTKRQAVAMRTGQGEAMPVIEIKPGYVERIALMDEYRLHDETRHHMMRRPRVTAEELPPEEAPSEEAPPAEEETPAEEGQEARR